MPFLLCACYGTHSAILDFVPTTVHRKSARYEDPLLGLSTYYLCDHLVCIARIREHIDAVDLLKKEHDDAEKCAVAGTIGYANDAIIRAFAYCVKKDCVIMTSMSARYFSRLLPNDMACENDQKEAVTSVYILEDPGVMDMLLERITTHSAVVMLLVGTETNGHIMPTVVHSATEQRTEVSAHEGTHVRIHEHIIHSDVCLYRVSHPPPKQRLRQPAAT